jgi:hypothetical protein
MDQKEGMSSNKELLFKGDYYALWKIRIKIYLMALGFDVWKSIENGYTTLATPPTDSAGNNICNDKSRAFNTILGGLTNPIFVKVMHCNSYKDISDKMEVIYEGDEKVKEAKIQTYRAQFENLKMKEEENIVEYLHRLYDLVNLIREDGE